MPNVPLVTELIKTDAQRQIIDLILTSQQMARLVTAPPDVPPDRVAALRNAFDAMLKDSEFIASATRLGLPVDAVSGVELQKLVGEMAKTPPEVITQFREVVGSDF